MNNTNYTPKVNDGKAGTNGIAGSINGASNAAGLTFALPATARATSILVTNTSPFIMRATQTLPSEVVAETGFVAQNFLIPPQGSTTITYNGDDQTTLVAQLVLPPAAGATTLAAAMTVVPAASITADYLIIVNYVNS